MNAKGFVAGSIVGGLVIFGLGYVIFVLLLGDFFAAHATVAGAAAVRSPPLYGALAIGSLAEAGLISLVLGSSRGAIGAGTGAKFGAVVGLVMWIAADSFNYGLNNVTDLTAVLVDPLAGAVLDCIAGAAIGFVAGKMKSA